MAVRQLPPSESLRRRVSLESRYGMCTARLVLSAKALMQLPSASSERLMLAPSVRRAPLLPVLVCTVATRARPGLVSRGLGWESASRKG
eukprot:2545276-Pleurochrysis_carterae.AAC.1